MSKKTVKHTDIFWKKKAISRRLVIVGLEKRIKELRASRDLWKHKYQQCSKGVVLNVDTKKAACHHYPIQVVLLLVLWQSYGLMSLRSVRHCFAQLQVVFALNCRVPSHVSIRHWVCKSGYYRLQKEQSAVFAPNERWAFIIDESIAIGSEKILLILGLPVSKWDFSKSLSKEDVRVLFVGTSKEWKAETISRHLETLGKTHIISYVVSDSGNNLRSALRQSSLIHIPDCTHVVANALARQYGKNDGYLSLSIGAGALRRKWFLSKKVVYMPPVQRSKARFQNIFPTIAWANDILTQWKDIPDDVRAELSFVQQEESLIKEMFQQITVLNALMKILKKKGLQQVPKRKQRR